MKNKRIMSKLPIVVIFFLAIVSLVLLVLSCFGVFGENNKAVEITMIVMCGVSFICAIIGVGIAIHEYRSNKRKKKDKKEN